jgi:hypothetical protein
MGAGERGSHNRRRGIGADANAGPEVELKSGRNGAIERIIVAAEAGQVSAELMRRGIAANMRVRVLVEVEEPTKLSMAGIAQAGGGAFAWLADEPELYSDADLVERTG